MTRVRFVPIAALFLFASGVVPASDDSKSHVLKVDGDRIHIPLKEIGTTFDINLGESIEGVIRTFDARIENQSSKAISEMSSKGSDTHSSLQGAQGASVGAGDSLELKLRMNPPTNRLASSVVAFGKVEGEFVQLFTLRLSGQVLPGFEILPSTISAQQLNRDKTARLQIRTNIPNGEIAPSGYQFSCSSPNISVKKVESVRGKLLVDLKVEGELKESGDYDAEFDVTAQVESKPITSKVSVRIFATRPSYITPSILNMRKTASGWLGSCIFTDKASSRDDDAPQFTIRSNEEDKNLAGSKSSFNAKITAKKISRPNSVGLYLVTIEVDENEPTNFSPYVLTASSNTSGKSNDCLVYFPH